MLYGIVPGMAAEYKESIPTELPLPYKGIVDQIWFDLLANREKFVKVSMRRLMVENPALAQMVLFMCTILPTSETREWSLDWTLAYYDIYSRSARRRRTAMITISQDLVNADYSEREIILKPLIDSHDEEGLRKYIEERERTRQDIVAPEGNRSEEIGKFSVGFHLSIVQQLRMGIINRETADLMMEPIQEIAVLFYRQIEANRLAVQLQDFQQNH